VAAVVHVVDDDETFRRSTARLLRALGYEVMVYESAQALLEQLPDDGGASCILLDVQIPGLSGPALQSRLVEIGSALPIVFITGHGDIPMTVRAIKAGAEDFLTKPVPKDKLIDAIERVVARHHVVREQYLRLQSLHSLIAKLTPRERQVFERVVRGKINKQIAFELGAAERTIKAHRERVMKKAGVQTLAELVSIAERAGILAHKAGG